MEPILQSKSCVNSTNMAGEKKGNCEDIHGADYTRFLSHMRVKPPGCYI